MSSDTANEDDTFGMANVDKTIIKYVGQKTRDRILVSLYLARFDAVSQKKSNILMLSQFLGSSSPPSFFSRLETCRCQHTSYSQGIVVRLVRFDGLLHFHFN